MNHAQNIKNIINDIKLTHPNETSKGWEPILRVYPQSKILIIGQAPGIKTQLENDVFKDRSGDRLREWMGVDNDLFYNSKLISILPMDFYFPGKGKTGDLPPNKEIAYKYHAQLIDQMPNLKLIILLGTYANKYYLKDQMKNNLTETIRNYEQYLPTYFPLVHPSPLNQRWMAKNRWFETDVLPVFLATVQAALID